MMKDLVILVADKNMEYTLKGLFTRPEALGIRSITPDIFVHPQRDPACALHGVEFLSTFSQQYDYGLLLFDYEGSGREVAVDQLQTSLNSAFNGSSWRERARAIVISPELEAWVWSMSPVVDAVVGWKGREPSLRRWLRQEGWWQPGDTKPNRPKEAFEAALYEAGRPRSSSLYLQLAERVSLEHCEEESFLEFKRVLQEWFFRA